MSSHISQNPSNPQYSKTATTSSPSSTSTISLDDLARKVDHIQSYEPALLAALAANAFIMLMLVIIGIILLRRRSRRGRGNSPDDGEPPSKPGFLQNPFGSMGFYGHSRAGRRTKRRGRTGPVGNTISTMNLEPNKDNAEEFHPDNSRISYRPVSLQNPDAAHMDSPSDMYRMSVLSSGLRNESVSMKLLPPSPTAPAMDPESSPMPRPGMGGVYDMPTRFRQSTASFRTEPYRDSAVL